MPRNSRFSLSCQWRMNLNFDLSCCVFVDFHLLFFFFHFNSQSRFQRHVEWDFSMRILMCRTANMSLHFAYFSRAYDVWHRFWIVCISLWPTCDDCASSCYNSCCHNEHTHTHTPCENGYIVQTKHQPRNQKRHRMRRQRRQKANKNRRIKCKDWMLIIIYGLIEFNDGDHAAVIAATKYPIRIFFAFIWHQHALARFTHRYFVGHGQFYLFIFVRRNFRPQNLHAKIQHFIPTAFIESNTSMCVGSCPKWKKKKRNCITLEYELFRM